MTSNTAAEATPPPTAQIYNFPNRSGGSHDPTELATNIVSLKLERIEEALEYIVPALYHDLFSAGFSSEDANLNALMIGSLRAIMYRHLNIHHPLTDFVDEHANELDVILNGDANASE